MKRRKQYEWKTYLEFTFYAICLLLILWVVASWVNVVMHNTSDYNYWTFNFFRIFWR